MTAADLDQQQDTPFRNLDDYLAIPRVTGLRVSPVLKPGNVKAWYGAVFAFLAQHVLGSKWERPDLL